jgi:dienelactone hydrolase
MESFMKPVTALAVSLAAAAFLACDNDPVDQDADPQLTLSRDSIALDVGISVSVIATVLNTSESAQFVSRNENVATVSANGAIKAVGVGSTYVVATLSNRPDVRDSVGVRVSPQPSNVDTCAIARPNFGVATAAERDLFAYDINAPLNLQKTVEIRNDVFEFSGISYNSPSGGSVTGILVEPVGRSGLLPAMVMMHPSGAPGGPAQGARILQFVAQQRAATGAVVIAIDAPFVRRGAAPMLLFTEQDRAEQIQLTKDLQRAVDVLIASGKVDPARIAFEGYSYGGIMGAQFVGIERRLKAAVLAAAMGGHITGMTTPLNMPNLNALSCATRNAWFGAMTQVEPIRFISNASPTALFFQAGRFDANVLPTDAQTLYDAAPQPKEIRWYDTGHGLNQQALWDRHDWLTQQIGIDARQP